MSNQTVSSTQAHPTLAANLPDLFAVGSVGAPALPGGVEMSPEQIIAYLGMRLGGIDDQFQAYKEQADRRAKIANELRDFKALVQECYVPGEGVAASNATPELVQRIRDGIAAIEKKYAPAAGEKPDPLGDPCKSILDGVSQLADTIGASQKDGVGPQSFDALCTRIDERVQALNSDNELTMMSLSQLMQSRSQVVSMCSNMLASLNESAKTILSKIG